MNEPAGLGGLMPQRPVFQARPDLGRMGPSAMNLARQQMPRAGVVGAPAPGIPRVGLHALAPHFAPQLMPRLGAARSLYAA